MHRNNEFYSYRRDTEKFIYVLERIVPKWNEARDRYKFDRKRGVSLSIDTLQLVYPRRPVQSPLTTHNSSPSCSPMYRLYLHCSQYIHTLYLVYFPFPACSSSHYTRLPFPPPSPSSFVSHYTDRVSFKIVPLSTRINLTSIKINKSYILKFNYNLNQFSSRCIYPSYNYVRVFQVYTNFYRPPLQKRGSKEECGKESNKKIIKITN